MIGEIHNHASMHRWTGIQRRIGITGGIASGKSSIGNFLKEKKGLPILDADVYAKEALGEGEPANIAVFERYGDSVKDQTKSNPSKINRSALGQIIFGNPKERFWIEQLLHPIILRRFKKELNANKNAPELALIIPLLFEAGWTGLCSEIWIINCTTQQQLKRLRKRDGLTNLEGQQRIKAQWPLEKKLHLADVVIDNSDEIEECLKVVAKHYTNNYP